jgi:hypothetical protein
MLALVEKIASGGPATRQEVRKETAKPKAQAGRPRAFIFNYKAPTKAFSLQLKFRKGTVERNEIITTLEDILRELREV